MNDVTSTESHTEDPGRSDAPVLQLDGIRKTYGGLIAVDEVSFTLHRDEILALIGPNGAGKTTLFNVINGFLKPDEGQVLLNGEDVTNELPHVHMKHGMGRTFQLVRPFGDMTIKENVMVGAFTQTRSRSEAEQGAVEMLEYLGMEDDADVVANEATVKQKKYMELGRTLATQPEILLIDEIVAGLNDEEMREILDIIRRINDDGTAVVLVEHVMDAVMSVSDRIVVLADGNLIADGPPQEIASDPRVVEAYLGEEYDVGGALDA